MWRHAPARKESIVGSATAGYKVHITETCDDDAPHLITHVETTTATATDEAALEPIHQALKERDLLPAEHLVDAGYVDAARLTESKKQYEVRLVGPLPDDNSWQTQAGKGYSPHCFVVDWEGQKVTCPAGKQSSGWTPAHTAWGKEAIHVHFAAARQHAGVVQHGKTARMYQIGTGRKRADIATCDQEQSILLYWRNERSSRALNSRKSTSVGQG